MSLSEIISVIWFFLPAILANMAPVFAARLPVIRNWSFPLDAFHEFRGKRLLGDHKTVRGLVAGVLTGIIVAVIQFYIIQPFWPWLNNLLPQYYLDASPIFLGGLLGLGVMVGDSIKSLFKRMLDIPAGRTWFPFDQLDSVVGAALVSCLYVTLSWPQYALVILGGLSLHILINAIGYFVGLRKQII